MVPSLPVTPAPLVLSGTLPVPLSFDPVAALIRDAEAQFAAGQQALQQGHLVAARDAFDRAVDGLLTAPVSVHSDARLETYFERLVDRVSALEAVALRQGDGFTETRSEAAAIDELLADSMLAHPAPATTTAELVAADLARTAHDIPLAVNDRVLSYVELFQGNLRPFLVDGLARGARYLPMIQDVFRAEGVPLDLAYVPLIESAFKSDALSRASAKGMWQFESDTAKEQGLTQNWWVDERSDPEKATQAAAVYLKDLHQMFSGDWYLALASYNSGMGRVDHAIKQSGIADFWQLTATPKYLPRETREYVPMILAAIIIASNPTQYGFDMPTTEPLSYDKVTVPNALDLRLAAEWTGTTIETIRGLNPELRRLATPAGAHDLKIPTGTADAFTAHLAEADPLTWTSFERRTVKANETLAGIARQYKIKTADLAGANQLKTTAKLQKGQQLLIPIAPTAALVSRPAGAAATPPAAVAQNQGAPLTYKVKAGDTLYGIAIKFDTTVGQIKRWNDLQTDAIGIGDRLTLYRQQH
jgi:membrane-bound lytic murein transglycosylase D